MDQQNLTFAKIPILDTGKFEQWQFRIQQYFQHEYYALWDVIEFRDSYEAPDDVVSTSLATEGTSKNKERTFALTTEDMQKRKNDVKARTTLLLALPDEHQLRFTKNSSGKEDVNTASIPTASTNVSPTSVNIGAEEDSIQGTDVAGFDKSKVECFNCHKMGHFARECRAPRSQDRRRRDNYRQGSKVEEQAPKALMAIDGVGQDWSFMENKEEDHALVADEETPTEFALMAKTSADSEVFDNSLCFKTCKKSTDSLNSKITELTDKLSDTKNTLYHYKLGLSQVKSRLIEFKNQEVKYCEKIRGLEFKVEARSNRIKCLTNELELLKKEKEGLERKLTGFQSASKDLDSLLKSQRSDKNKKGLGYNDIVTDYSKPSPAIESTSDDFQNRNPSVTETGASPSNIVSKPFIKFVKVTNSPTKNKADKVETFRKTTVKYAELYRKTSKSVDHLSYNCGKWVDHGRTWEKNNNTHKSRTPKIVFHKAGSLQMRTNRPYMNAAQSKRTSFYKPAHSYNKRPFQRTSVVRSQFRGPRVATVNRNFPTVNRKFPTGNRKFPTGNTKFSTADMGNKGKVVKASACWIWKPI
nr:hypothetical protein [Tanacetum cinerariifolium]